MRSVLKLLSINKKRYELSLMFGQDWNQNTKEKRRKFKK